MYSLRNISPLRRVLLGVSGALLIAAAALLSAGLYSLVDGGDARQDKEVIDLGEADAAEILHLSSPAPSPSSGTASTAGTPGPTPRPPLGDGPYMMTIDSIGVDAPVQTLGLDEHAVPEVPTGPNAGRAVAYYNFSALPATGSNAVFAGHVTWKGRAVFFDLDDIQVGDVIQLRGRLGAEVVYSVSSKFSVDPDDPDSLKVMYGTDRDVITLITCDGTFRSTNDPTYGGEYNQRLVVRGDLVRVTQPRAERVVGGGY